MIGVIGCRLQVIRKERRMIEIVENLRLLAGVMFWLFADLFLGMCWIAVILGVLAMIIKGARDDD